MRLRTACTAARSSRERRIAEPQLDRAEAAGRAAFRLRRRARRDRPSGRARKCCRPGSAAARRRASAHSGMLGRDRRAHPSRRRRSPPSPCARRPARRSARSAARASPTAPADRSRSPLVDALDLAEQAGDRRRRRAQIAEQIGAAGDALLGLDVDQQQRHLRGRRPWLVPSTKFGGTSTGVARIARTVRRGETGGFGMETPGQAAL